MSAIHSFANSLLGDTKSKLSWDISEYISITDDYIHIKRNPGDFPAIFAGFTFVAFGLDVDENPIYFSPAAGIVRSVQTPARFIPSRLKMIGGALSIEALNKLRAMDLTRDSYSYWDLCRDDYKAHLKETYFIRVPPQFVVENSGPLWNTW